MDKTLLKGLRMLELLAVARPPLRGLEDLAARLRLSRSTAHRTFATLVHAGYARRDTASGTYVVTRKALALGFAELGMHTLTDVAPCFLTTLAHATGETVHLSELRGNDVYYLDKIESRQPVRAYSEIGGLAPAHAVATGKALLSVQPSAALDALPSELPRYTARTLCTRPALRAELEQSARRGYAINRGEWRDDVGGIAAVVNGDAGLPIAALGVSGPLNRLTDARMAELAPQVMALAERLSLTLQYLHGLAAAPPDDGA